MPNNCSSLDLAQQDHICGQNLNFKLQNGIYIYMLIPLVQADKYEISSKAKTGVKGIQPWFPIPNIHPK